MPPSLYEHRRQPKIDVYHQRRIPGEHPYCPICSKKITIESGADLHEVFFARGELQGVDENRIGFAIFHRCNVVLVHHGDCHLKAQHTPEGKSKCAHQIVLYEGKLPVMEYLDTMRGFLKNTQAADFERVYVSGIANEMQVGSTPQPRWNFE